MNPHLVAAVWMAMPLVASLISISAAVVTTRRKRAIAADADRCVAQGRH